MREIDAHNAPYPWEPGTVMRYRDHDFYLLGAALEGFLKSVKGADVDLWDMLRNEVLEPYRARTTHPSSEPGNPAAGQGCVVMRGLLPDSGRSGQNRHALPGWGSARRPADSRSQAHRSDFLHGKHHPSEHRHGPGPALAAGRRRQGAALQNGLSLFSLCRRAHRQADLPTDDARIERQHRHAVSKPRHCNAPGQGVADAQGRPA